MTDFIQILKNQQVLRDYDNHAEMQRLQPCDNCGRLGKFMHQCDLCAEENRTGIFQPVCVKGLHGGNDLPIHEAFVALYLRPHEWNQPYAPLVDLGALTVPEDRMTRPVGPPGHENQIIRFTHTIFSMRHVNRAANHQAGNAGRLRHDVLRLFQGGSYARLGLRIHDGTQESAEFRSMIANFHQAIGFEE